MNSHKIITAKIGIFENRFLISFLNFISDSSDKIYKYAGWNVIVQGNLNGWGLQYYDPGNYYAPIRQNGKKK